MKRPKRLVTGLMAALLFVVAPGCVGADDLASVLADDVALVAASATQGYLLGFLEGPAPG